MKCGRFQGFESGPLKKHVPDVVSKRWRPARVKDSLP